MEKTYMISKDKVECLKVPRVVFARYNQLGLLDLLKKDLDILIPDDEKAFQCYVRDMKWQSFRKQLVEDICKTKSIPNRTTLEDVPFTIRLEQPEHMEDNFC